MNEPANLPPLKFPVVLMSRDGQCFRRIQADGLLEKKRLGMDWETANPDSPFIALPRVRGYITTMTQRIGWKQS